MISSIQKVSIVIPTYDRPDALATCLQSLIAQRADFAIEIIIVDNHPETGITPPVVARYAGVRCLSEARQGISYARNTGIRNAEGEIIVATDDDITAPPGWIAALVMPFERPEISAVTGNILPISLEKRAERLFEAYTSMKRDDQPRLFERAWLKSKGWHLAPLWEIGMTANAAFRATVFRDPRVGLLDEALGAGSPTGAFEDLYCFYKMLHADYRLEYAPSGWLYHAHRRDMQGLYRQLKSYRRGESAFYLLLFLRHGDWRALMQLIIWLPAQRCLVLCKELKRRRNGRKLLPFRLIWHENISYLLGPFALWKSLRRVQQVGVSEPLTAPSTPPNAQEDHP